MADTRRLAVQVGDQELELSNLDKVFYPESGFTKGQVIDYYTRMAPHVLPHIRERPLTLKRYPDGVDGPFFYQKECPLHRPDWLETTAIWSEGNQRMVNYCVVNDLPGLVWVANLADLELHTFLSTRRDPDTPTMVMFDLDPGEPANVIDCAAVAILLRDLLDNVGLACWVKTSGSKGLQLVVPLNTPNTFGRTKAFARTIANLLASTVPGRVTSTMTKSLRVGRVFIDWSQNDARKTTVSVYSLRARSLPTVSTPVLWNEVEDAYAEDDPERLVFDAETVLDRVDAMGDIFAPVLTLTQKLPGFETTT